MEIGDRASRTVVVTEDAIALFVNLSGDSNPIHSDEAFAVTTRFGRRIAPGIQIASYISAVIANDLPGPGSIYLEQSLRFEAPVFIGDEITITVSVVEFPRAGRVKLETVCINQVGAKVISGTALVKPPECA